MPTAVVMPKLGMTMEQGTVTEWPIALGARVEKGNVVLVIETEKSEVEIKATATGYLRHVYEDVGRTVPTGTLLAVLTSEPDEEIDPEAYRREHRATAVAKDRSRSQTPGSPSVAGRTTDGQSSSRRLAAPRARRAAAALGVELSRVLGSGPGGRITEEDVRSYAGDRPALVETAPGVAIEVLSEGDGPAVLFVPGFGTDASIFESQIAALVGEHRVLALNPRGIGRSTAPDGELYSVADGATDTVAVCRALCDDPVHLVGTSLGAAVALEAALHHPERVVSLFLIAPLLQPSPRLLAVIDAWQRLVDAASPEVAAAALLPWLFSDGHLSDPRTRDRARDGLRLLLARIDAAAVRRWARGLQAWSPPTSDELRRMAVPTSVVVGESDLLTPFVEDDWSGLAELEITRVGEGGHALCLESSDEVSRALRLHFLRRNLASR